MPLGVLWPLTERWYGDRLATDFRPRPVADLQRLLVAAGLTASFWSLT